MNWRQISVLLAASAILPAGSVTANQLNISSTSVSQSNTSVRSGKIAQASSDTPNFKRRRRGKGGMKKIFEQLNLNTEQQERIKAIRQESKENNSSLRQEMRQAKEEMRKLMIQNASSDSTLRQQHEKIQNLKKELGNQRFETMLKIRQVLTPEQRSKMAELKQQRRQNFRKRWQGRRYKDS